MWRRRRRAGNRLSRQPNRRGDSRVLPSLRGTGPGLPFPSPLPGSSGPAPALSWRLATARRSDFLAQIARSNPAARLRLSSRNWCKRLWAQVPDRRIVRPAIGIDHRAVMAKPGGAIDQQSPATVGSQVIEGDRQSPIWRRSSLDRLIVMGIALLHSVSIRSMRRRRRPHVGHAMRSTSSLPTRPPIVPSDGMAPQMFLHQR
jgi:hypothetical protein